MDDFDKNIIKTLELIIYKLNEKWGGIHYVEYIEDKDNDIVALFEEDLKRLGMSIYEINSYLEFIERKEHITICNVIDPDRVDPLEIPHHFIDTGINGGEFRIPVFIIEINDSAIEVLEQYKRGNKPKDIIEHPIFDDEKSILSIDKYKIKIARQDKKTIEHRILKNILINHKDEINRDFYYSEIADEEFEDESYMENKDNWKKFNSACESINKKIEETTEGKIKNFLISNSSIKGKVFINKDYINIQ